jgi:hypothetical protein
MYSFFQALILVSTLIVRVARASYHMGKRFLVQTDGEILERCDKKAFVLYLRPFKEDGAPRFVFKWTNIAHEMFQYKLSEEMIIANCLKSVGIGIAVGRPGEKLPKLGMYRFYPPGSMWKDKVIELMRKAKLVVIHASSEPGYWWWELRSAIENVKPEQLVILLSFENYKTISILSLTVDRKDEYEIFRKRVEHAFPHKLPSFYGVRIDGSRLTGIIYFDTDWIPYIVGLSEFGLENFEATFNRTFSYVLGKIGLRSETESP